MYSATTKGIKVSVKPTYDKLMSKPSLNKYLHSYEVTILNESEYTCQLISREWHIKDSNGDHRSVRGDGVIGLQPTLSPGTFHTYTSWCPLLSPIGYMYGIYNFKRIADGVLFEVEIPRFDLIADHKSN